MYRMGFGFDHCIKVNNPVPSQVFPDWTTSCGYNGPQVGSGITSAGVDQDGWLGAYHPSNEQRIPFLLNGIVPALTTKVTIGFRIKTLNLYGSTHSIIHLASAASPLDITTYLFTAGPTSPWVPAVGAGDVWVELTYNFATGIVQGLVNGVAIADYQAVALPAAIKAAWAAGTGAFNFRLGNNLNARYAIRDVTILDDLAGDGIVGPIGPQRLWPVYTDSADGAGWSSSINGQTLLQTLTAPLPAAGVLNSPLDKTPLVCSLKTDAPAGSRITAVSLALGGFGRGDANTISKVQLIQGAANTPNRFVTLPRATPGYGSIVGVYPLAPDGQAWSLAKLDATTIKITPDTPT